MNKNKTSGKSIRISNHWHEYLKRKAGNKHKLQGLIEELLEEDAAKLENKKFLLKSTNGL